MEETQREENAVVLDFLQHGYPSDTRPAHVKTPVVQAVGKQRFALLELVPKKDVFLQPYEDVYLGEGKRDKIHHIQGKIEYHKLTPTAQAELEHVIREIIEANEQRFVDFFNNAQPLSTRMHQLELLPGLGKKHMWEVVEERKGEPFKSLKELKDRVHLMPDPVKLLVKRIVSEIKGEEKHRIFAR